MCNNDNEKSCGCIAEILKNILMLQNQDFDNECHTGCTKPYLGPTCNAICYNTRPITLFNCCTGEPWTFPYVINNTTYYSSLFRIEALDDCCCTCRILYTNEENNSVVSTNEFFTLDLRCVGAIKCSPDVSVDLC